MNEDWKQVEWCGLVATYRPYESEIMREYVQAGRVDEAKVIHEFKARFDARILKEAETPKPEPEPERPSPELRRDATAAEIAGEEGMAQADQAERVQEWKDEAERWLGGRSRDSEITADDLIADIGLPDIGPSRNNVVGAWFAGQAKRGRLAFAGRLRKSERVIRHGNLQRVWRVT